MVDKAIRDMLARVFGRSREGCELVAPGQVGCRLDVTHRHRATVHSVIKAFEAWNHDAELNWWSERRLLGARFVIWSASPTAVHDLVAVISRAIGRSKINGGDDGDVVSLFDTTIESHSGRFQGADRPTEDRLRHIRALLDNGRSAEAKAETNRLLTALHSSGA